MNGDDVRMVQRRGGAGFTLEALDAIGIGRQVAANHLDRDGASETRVAGPVDLAHATCAEQRKDLVRAKASAWG